ncbi:hypothetical protein QN382_03480 [Pseudomonas sp. 10B1]|uniref:hypothetical protein n=1 Tax=Pseudomonas sp. 10B1 TaxID=3048573 RepID=UPI002B2269F8|nr:hypothetical protein [Pseudomonas sp. 10B1]MEB0308346.1 hypothetical protein [Pseudomonas sp. 10B1]
MTTDYSRPERTPFPRDLAAMIARKADALARRFEDQAVKAMVRDAQRALDRGESQAHIVRELALK